MVVRIHSQVDAAVEPLERRHAGRLRCRRGCHDCCVDGITVFAVEAERIRERHAELLRSGDPHPEGKCAFLDGDGVCRIYVDRPYVCRTQGLPLRWLDEVSEKRDICPLNDHGKALTELPAEACWTLGPYEGKLASLQRERDGGEMRRIGLRSLFTRGEPR